MTNISVIGLGKLGACTAACFALKGFNTYGIDLNKNILDSVNNRKAPVNEPGLQEIINITDGRLSAGLDYAMAIRETDISFLILPTPSMPDGNFSDVFLQNALTELASAFAEIEKDYHLFVIVSTVSPGNTEENLIPHLEKLSGKKLNLDFGVCYNPQFIALGSVINDFLNPELVLIGESSPKAGQMLAALYNLIFENKPYIARMSVISAEIAKISLNSYITMKISFANTLANICEKVPGADIDGITKAIGADKRISPYYLKGGTGFGGPCFPRDNRAFAAFAGKYGIDALLAKATDKVNQYQADHLVKIIISEAANNTAAVLGISYKPGTPVIEESAALKIIEMLLNEGIKVIAYDALAIENAKDYFKGRVSYAASIKECLAGASVCVITTVSEEFKEIDKSCFSEPITLIDCWRILAGVELGDQVKYISPGRFK
jgi:UDPglucose 6-dehydrogenase